MKGDVMNDDKMPAWAAAAADGMEDRLGKCLRNSGGLKTSWHSEESRLVVADGHGTGLEATQSDSGRPVFGYRLDGVADRSFRGTVDEALNRLQQAWRASPGRLTIFTKDHCPACAVTRRQLDKAGVSYMLIDLAGAEAERAEFVEQGIRQAPVVEVAGQKPYGGFDPAKIKDIIATSFPPTSTPRPAPIGHENGGHRPTPAQPDHTRGRGR